MKSIMTRHIEVTVYEFGGAEPVFKHQNSVLSLRKFDLKYIETLVDQELRAIKKRFSIVENPEIVVKIIEQYRFFKTEDPSGVPYPDEVR